MGMRIGVSTERDRLNGSLGYLGVREWCSAFAFLGVLSCAWFWIESWTVWAIFVGVALSKYAESISDLCYGYFQKAARVELTAFSQILRSCSTVGAFWVVLSNGGKVPSALILQSTFWFVVSYVIDVRSAHRHGLVTPRVPGTLALRRTLKRYFLLGTGDLVAQLSGSAPRIAVAIVLGLSALGQFSIVAYLLQIGTVFVQQINHALSARFARSFNSRRYTDIISVVAKVLGLYTVLFLLMLLALYFAGDVSRLLALAFGDEYTGVAAIFPMAVFAIYLRSLALVLQVVALAKREFGRILWMRVGVLLLGCILLFFGAVHGGLEGVVWAIIGAAVIHAGWALCLAISRA